MDKSYWHRYQARISRRRVLVATGALSAGALIAACGGGNESGSSNTSSRSSANPSGAMTTSGGASSLLYQPVDTTSSAKAGGTYRDVQNADVTTFDVLASQANPTEIVGGFVYSRLLKPKPGKMQPAMGDVEGDLANSFEVSPDGLQVTLKLRQDAKWDQREPTNSRLVDTDDVLFSWNKFASSHPFRGTLVNSVSQAASIASVTSPDKSTIVVKLAFPDGGILTDLASSAYLFIQPREAESGFDPRNEARGSGAWVVKDYKPSIGITYSKNPNWWQSNLPFIDEWQSPVVPDYANRLSQLKAGNVYTTTINVDDILPTKQDVAALNMAQATAWPTPYVCWQFGWQENTVFIDDRIRKAASLSLDRELLVTRFNNVDKFAAAGLEVPIRYNSHIPANLDGWWIDPLTPDIGDGGQWFKHDVEQGKQLMSAAGYSNGLEVPLLYSAPYATYQEQIEVHESMFAEIGLRTKFQVLDYQTEFLPKVADNKGKYEGVATILDVITEAGQFMKAVLLPEGGSNHGFFAKGHFGEGDPQVTATVKKIRGEFDLAKRQSMGKDLARYLATQMYYIPYPGSALGFTLSWPVIGNFGVYREGGRTGGRPQETFLYYWIDNTKRPLAG